MSTTLMRLPPMDTWRRAGAGPWSNPTPASTRPRAPRNAPAVAVATFLTKSLRVGIVSSSFTGMSGRRSRPSGERRLHALRSKGNLADASAGGVENRIADGGRDNRDCRFARAGCLLVSPIDEDGLDLWDLAAQIHRVIGFPVDRCHLLVVPRDFFHERAAQALEGSAFGLILQAIGARDRSAVLGDDQPLHDNRACALIDVDFGHHPRISVLAFVPHAGDPTAADDAGSPNAGSGRGTRVPVGGLRRRFHDIDDPGIAQVTQPIGHGVGFHPGRDFVHERLVSEGVLEPLWRSQRSRPEEPFEAMREDALALDGAGAPARVTDAADNIRRGRVVAVVEPAGGIWSWRLWDKRRGREAGQKSRDDISRGLVARPVSQSRRPAFVVPGDDIALGVQPRALIDD